MKLSALREWIPFIKNKQIVPPPIDIPAKTLQNLAADPATSKLQQEMSARTGSYLDKTDLGRLISEELTLSLYRRNLYYEAQDACGHALVNGALERYVDSCCGKNHLTNASVWVTSDDERTENVLNQFLSDITIESRIRDWTGNLAKNGDLFIEPIGAMGSGVMYIDDNIHPADMERIDINGRLEGFVRTQLQSQTTSPLDLEPPWKYVHFRLFGMRNQIVNTTLGLFGDPGTRYGFEGIRPNSTLFRVTTRYGVSLIAPAVPVYKRLKMSEDTIMLARVSRGMLWYLYKIKLDSGMADQAGVILRDYASKLKRTTGMDTGTQVGHSKYFKDKFSPIFAQVEDMFVPETESMSVSVEKMGGEVDIKAIVDVEMLEDRLLAALRCSRTMLGLSNEGAIFGQTAQTRVSIDFARNALRLQEAMRDGVARLCQLHLAYLGDDADPTKFEVHFAEISTAEEEEIKNAMSSGVDIVDKMVEVMAKSVGEGAIKRVQLLDYLVKKVLKLDDFEVTNFIALQPGTQPAPEGEAVPPMGAEGEIPAEGANIDMAKTLESLREALKTKKKKAGRGRIVISNEDLFALLPSSESPKRYRLFEGKLDLDTKVEWNPPKVVFTKENGGV